MHKDEKTVSLVVKSITKEVSLVINSHMIEIKWDKQWFINLRLETQHVKMNLFIYSSLLLYGAASLSRASF